MRTLTLDRIRSIERIACTEGKADLDSRCFRIVFADLGPDMFGDWSIITQGHRPLKLHLEESQPPVV